VQAGLLDLRNAQIAVQGGGKRQVLPATVMHGQLHTQRAGPELNCEHCFKGVRPDGARCFAVRQAQGDLHTILAQWARSIGLPVADARKAMLDQGATLIELGKQTGMPPRMALLPSWAALGLRNRRSCPRPIQDSTWAPCRQISTESP
jgi:hypothetical protein